MAWQHGVYRYPTLVGTRFGKLLVIGRDPVIHGRGTNSSWICQCDCGTVKSVMRTSLVNKRTVSCGCFGKEGGRNHKKRVVAIVEPIEMVERSEILDVWAHQMTTLLHGGHLPELTTPEGRVHKIKG